MRTALYKMMQMVGFKPCGRIYVINMGCMSNGAELPQGRSWRSALKEDMYDRINILRAGRANLPGSPVRGNQPGETPAMRPSCILSYVGWVLKSFDPFGTMIWNFEVVPPLGL